eukprot:scaffold46095_cov70-Attheya_sp.AAC.2
MAQPPIDTCIRWLSLLFPQATRQDFIHPCTTPLPEVQCCNLAAISGFRAALLRLYGIRSCKQDLLPMPITWRKNPATVTIRSQPRIRTTQAGSNRSKATVSITRTRVAATIDGRLTCPFTLLAASRLRIASHRHLLAHAGTAQINPTVQYQGFTGRPPFLASSLSYSVKKMEVTESGINSTDNNQIDDPSIGHPPMPMD